MRASAKRALPLRHAPHLHLNRFRIITCSALRQANGLTQAELVAKSGITRQAVYAIEANQYLPTTAVALRLADALDRRVEDLFSLVATGEAIEGDLIGSPPTGAPCSSQVRVK